MIAVILVMVVMVFFAALVMMVVAPVFAPILVLVLAFLAVTSAAAVVLLLRNGLRPVLMLVLAVRDAQGVREVQRIWKPLGLEMEPAQERASHQQEQAGCVSGHMYLVGEVGGRPILALPIHYLAPIPWNPGVPFRDLSGTTKGAHWRPEFVAVTPEAVPEGAGG